jgi:nucleoside-diphosphate-sugar epimerase
MNILIVGGAGYVGGWITELLSYSNHNLRVIDNLLYDDTYFKETDFYNIDINDTNNINPHFAWADTVVWLAALVGDPACSLNPSLTLNTNVNSVRNLVDNFKGKIIFLSTCSIYGAQDGLLDENSIFNPLSLYAETKIAAEKIILDSKNAYFIFRLGTLYGVSDRFSRLRADLVVNILTIRAFIENQMSVFGGMQYRPLLHVRDVAHAVDLALNSDKYGVYNLHSENMTVLEIAEIVPVDALNDILLVDTLAVWFEPAAPTITGYKSVVATSFVALIVVDGPALPE